MKRSNLFLSALILGSAMAGHQLAARESKPADRPSSGSRAVGPVHHPEAHVERKNADPISVHHSEAHVERKNADPVAHEKLDKRHLEPPPRERDKDREASNRDDRFREHREREFDHDRDHRFRYERPDHSFVVTTRGGHGYIEREYRYHDHEFVHRTYYVHGVAYPRFYQPYYYRGVALHVYAPGYYYAPAFYGWVYNPWVAPVTWEWGWARHPWFRFYGAWFQPYPVYTSPSLWLTDYFLAQTLEAAYQERLAADARRAALAADFAATPLTPEVKRAIAEEVRRQLALENAEAMSRSQGAPDPASSGLARMLGDHMAHVFVVANGLEAISDGGRCTLTEGDVIQLAGPTAPNAPTANLVVLASKGGECRKSSIVGLGLAELQEMQNHMRATIDQGLGELHAKQGQGGLPPAPPSAAKPPVQAEFAAIAPPPDPNGEAAIQQQAAGR